MSSREKLVKIIAGELGQGTSMFVPRAAAAIEAAGFVDLSVPGEGPYTVVGEVAGGEDGWEVWSADGWIEMVCGSERDAVAVCAALNAGEKP